MELKEIFKNKSKEELDTVEIIYNNNKGNFEDSLNQCLQIFGEEIE